METGFGFMLFLKTLVQNSLVHPELLKVYIRDGSKQKMPYECNIVFEQLTERWGSRQNSDPRKSSVSG